MGSWGPQLYQDDFAQDLRDVYKDQLKRGKKSKFYIRMDRRVHLFFCLCTINRETAVAPRLS